tara:strand:+ start:285 stop:872 length:588 start_codon:yes stop_codon:yes gene_type:complete
MSNSGIFDVNDIRYLMDYQQWSGVGTLELIQTETITSETLVEFNLTGNYNVYFLTFNDVVLVDTKELIMRVSTDGGSTFNASTNYNNASQRGDSAGNFYEYRLPNNTQFQPLSSMGSDTNETHNGYIYMYNFLDSAKYSYLTYHTMGYDLSGNAEFHFGSAGKESAEYNDAIQFKDSGGSGVQSGVFSLYGIRYS